MWFDGRFEGKVALVTGSSRNLGKAIAYRFGKEGGSVIINNYSNVAELEATAKEFRAEGIKVLPVRADVTDGEQVDNMVHKGVEAFSKIDFLVLSTRIRSPAQAILGDHQGGVARCTGEDER